MHLWVAITLAWLLLFAQQAMASPAATHMGTVPDMVHAGHAKAGHASAAGRLGKKGQVDRTIKIDASDAMRFKPASITVQQGDTVRFVVTNSGSVVHEFVIATAAQQREHDAMMRRMPNVAHEEPNVVTLKPGETGTLIWQFTRPGSVQYACHEPGHYAAGMVGIVNVEPTKQPHKSG